MNKYYAVKKGRKIGIFKTWSDCEKQVKNFSGAKYKSFKSKKDAREWLQTTTNNESLTTKSINDYEIIIYTDGGSRNHGTKKGQHVKADDKAAWAYYIKYGEYSSKDTGGEYGSTNNRMEILALKNALQKILLTDLQTKKIKVVIDSRYVLDTITKGWLYNWNKNNWKTSSGSEVKNKELWQEILEILPKFKNISYQWTKGHANDEGNNLVDYLLNKTMDLM